jgi:hypothetical protein
MDLFWTVRYSTARCTASDFPLNVRITLHFASKAEVEVGAIVSPADVMVLPYGSRLDQYPAKGKLRCFEGKNEVVRGKMTVPKDIIRQTFTIGATAEMLN